MLEDQPIKSELSVKKKQQVEHKLEGVIKPNRGHKVWEINTVTNEIRAADYKSDTAGYYWRNPHHEKLIQKADCIYIPALNIENARRKYQNNQSQGFYYAKEPLMNLNEIFNCSSHL